MKIKIKIIALLIMIISTTIISTGCSSDEFNLNDYIVIETKGKDGRGKIDVYFDYKKAEKDFASINEIAVKDLDFEDFEDKITLSSDDDLSNGDIVELMWNMEKNEKALKYKEEIEAMYDCEIVFDDMEIKIKGLKED